MFEAAVLSGLSERTERCKDGLYWRIVFGGVQIELSIVQLGRGNVMSVSLLGARSRTGVRGNCRGTNDVTSNHKQVLLSSRYCQHSTISFTFKQVKHGPDLDLDWGSLIDHGLSILCGQFREFKFVDS